MNKSLDGKYVNDGKVRKMKRIRESLGYSLADVADIAGVTKSTVSYWENGHKTPTKNKREVIALLYDVDIDRLMEPEDEENS